MSAQVCKEELCKAKAKAMVETGHAYAEAGEWTPEELAQWIELLDSFATKAEQMFLAGPVAEGSRGRRGQVAP